MYIYIFNIHNKNGDRMENCELIKHIHEDSLMGEYATERLINELKEKDNKIKTELENIHKEYVSYKEKTEKLLIKKHEQIKDASLMVKMGTYFGIKKEVLEDNSDSSIADMLIKGLSMGSIEMEKKLNTYKECDKKHVKLANDFLEFQQNYIELMKAYL